MPHKRKDSPFWWITYTDSCGKRSRESSGTTNRKEAAALESKRRLEAHQVTFWNQEPSRTFDELLVGYLQETNRKKSHERDLYSAKRLQPFFTGCNLNDLAPQKINDYKRLRRHDQVKDSTIIKELRLFSAAINHAKKEWGWNINNPITGKVPKQPKGRVRWITQEQAADLIEAAKAPRLAHLAPIIKMALNTGMRKGELLGLEWSRVDLGNRLIYLEPDHAKSGQHESIPLNDTAVQALREQWRKHKRWVFTYHDKRINSIKNSYAAACKKAGINDFTFHDLRHTFAAWLVQMGTPIRTVSDLLRHSDITTTMRYAHLAPENVHQAVAGLDDLQRDQIVTQTSKNMQKTANSCKIVTHKTA